MNAQRNISLLVATAAMWAASLDFARGQDGPPTATSMATFRFAHPRLIVTDADLLATKRAIANDPFARAQFEALRSRSEGMLRQQPDRYAMDAENDLQRTVRNMEDRVLTLAGMYRLTGDRRYSTRATQEMLAAASFSDWNPKHFLDTAELTTALGIGYDWLYPVLTPAERETIRRAVQLKGIAPFLEQLHAKKVHYTNNWGQVCFGGETVGALAVAESSDPASISQAAEIVGYARPALASLMRLFIPDGGFDEGPGYWNYATSYNAIYLAALQSSLGTDFGQGAAAGFSQTGDYRIQSTGPIFQSANFGDAEPLISPAPQMFWFARRFNRAEYPTSEREIEKQLTIGSADESNRFNILGLFWYSLGPHGGSSRTSPLYRSFSRIDQGFIRLSWSDPNTWYVAFKGGDAQASHGHLDLGSFVLDALGFRWGIDPGSDNYFLPGYFGPQRWTYYRMRTEAHNTLTVDNVNEDLDAKASISPIQKRSDRLFSIIDLSNAYKTQLKQWHRGVALLADGGFLVQDEVVPARPSDVVWHFHTYANVVLSPDGRTATLFKGGPSIKARILTPSLHFERVMPETFPPEKSVVGITDLVIRLPKLSTSSTIAVLFSSSTDPGKVQEKALGSW